MTADTFTAERVRALRARSGMTQAQFAAAMGLALRQYGKLERGELRCRKLHRMAMAAVVWGHDDPIDWDL